MEAYKIPRTAYVSTAVHSREILKKVSCCTKVEVLFNNCYIAEVTEAFILKDDDAYILTYFV